ncbi:MAG TPA: DUF2232 domain-containing protein [Gemmatimonadaceae bacterium]|nr:DUF2232 domain-containing protein [Gemmatimonadaceae bacterium]
MTVPVAPAPAERGWGKLILAIAAFLIVPTIPQFQALLPVQHTLLLIVPALAACCLVGWWAGGRLTLALVWVAAAVYLVLQKPDAPSVFFNLQRGWSLLLAGAFGLVCLFGVRRPLFVRALVALSIALLLAVVMSALGPVTAAEVHTAVQTELAQRNTQTMNTFNTFIGQHPDDWNNLVKRIPQLGQMPAETQTMLTALAKAGVGLYPSLLVLESLVALALAWSTYHRLGRARLGPPLAPLRDFRFNDQLVWGLIVGLTIVFLPTLSAFAVFGQNLLVLFGALYAVRGLGVLSWFLAPGALAVMAIVGFVMLWAPVLNAVAVLGFMLLALAAFGLGLGDTWADWRNRARPTS